MKLNAARVHAKLGNIDEAIEILGDFENSPDADVNKTIVRIFNLNFSTVEIFDSKIFQKISRESQSSKWSLY